MSNQAPKSQEWSGPFFKTVRVHCNAPRCCLGKVGRHQGVDRGQRRHATTNDSRGKTERNCHTIPSKRGHRILGMGRYGKMLHPCFHPVHKSSRILFQAQYMYQQLRWELYDFIDPVSLIAFCSVTNAKIIRKFILHVMTHQWKITLTLICWWQRAAKNGKEIETKARQTWLSNGPKDKKKQFSRNIL